MARVNVTLGPGSAQGASSAKPAIVDNLLGLGFVPGAHDVSMTPVCGALAPFQPRADARAARVWCHEARCVFRGLVVLADCLVMSYTASASYPRSARRAADPGEAPLRDCAESLRPGHHFQRELDDAKDARATLAKYTQKRFIVLCI